MAQGVRGRGVRGRGRAGGTGRERAHCRGGEKEKGVSWGRRRLKSIPKKNFRSRESEELFLLSREGEYRGEGAEFAPFQ